VKVFAKQFAFDAVVQISIRGGNDTYVCDGGAR
jgi:hypothetical protein